MKTNLMILLLLSTMIIIVLFTNQNLHSQTWTELSKVGGSPSIIIQYDFLYRNQIGIGPDFIPPNNYTPRAKFHQREEKTTTPVTMYEVTDIYDSTLCSMRFLFNENNVDYNLYQTGNGYKSYFDGPVGSGTSLFLKGENPDFSIVGTNTCPFNMAASPSSPVFTPLTLYRAKKVEVRDTLECQNVKMIEGAGMNKILVSDAHGNGTWIDPYGFDDRKWLINNFGDMYASPYRNHIGIGFQGSGERIFQKLHVVDGNILLSRLHGGNPCSLNGSLLFGDNQVSDEYPNGKWGIEYYDGGLNFWKVYNRSLESEDTPMDEDPNNYRLFLSDNGSVGIGCKDTHGYKLAVYGNILCEEVLIRTHPNWPDYVFSEQYDLLSIYDLEKFIKKNKHLPEVPTADEVNENGVKIGDLSAALLKKIEELTRYVIEQQKEIDYLKSAIAGVK